MNIVIVGTAYPLRGGIAHYIALLYRNLQRRHKVNIVTFSRQYPEFLFPGKTQREQGGGDAGRVPAEALIDSINPFTWRSAAQRIAALQPDLVIYKYWIPFFGPCFGYIARRVKKLTGGKARIVFICDNIIPHERRWFDRMFTNYAFRAVDGCIVQSRAVERDLKLLYPGIPYRHVPHPIYDIFGRPVAKRDARHRLGVRDERVMLFFGYVRKYKGLEVLLKAMPEIVRRVKVKLLVVGEFYGDEKEYRKMVKDLKIERDVEFRPEYVPNDQVAPYFCASDVVALPYISATQSGIVQIAYNFDKPVIATNVGGLGEVVIDEKSGLIVSPENPHAFAEAVIRYYKEKLEGTFVRGIHEEKKKYSWEHLVKGIEELTKELLVRQKQNANSQISTFKKQSPNLHRQESRGQKHQSSNSREGRRPDMHGGRRDSGRGPGNVRGETRGERDERRQAPTPQDPRRHENLRQPSPPPQQRDDRDSRDTTPRMDEQNAKPPESQPQQKPPHNKPHNKRRGGRWRGPRGQGTQQPPNV